MNLNKVIILGRVTATPHLRTTPGGQSVSSMGVATNRQWTGKDGQKQEEVEFHNVVLWGKQAEVAAQFLVKGSLVLIEGRLATRSWTTKDSQERRTTEIIADHLELGPKPDGTAKALNPEKSKHHDQDEILPEWPGAEGAKADDIPFF